ncbi:amino acid adenylation domain-containing protein [Streptomyces sp. NPDC087897]|uniref:non-ribosomal peptide synthetase n=1 Tax=Streptomyces sp. NPDC087897 TaxID=3365817 RepID=UPI003830E0BD
MPDTLITDRPRPASPGGHSSAADFTVPPGPTAALTGLALDHGATLDDTLLTAYATLLARHTRRWDLPVAVPRRRPGHPEPTPAAADFTDPVVLRCALRARDPFTEALAAVRDLCRTAHAQTPPAPHTAPGTTGTGASAGDGDGDGDGGQYHFAFVFHQQETAAEAARAPRTDLTLVMHRTADSTLHGAFVYDTALFTPATVRFLAAQFRRLLEAVAADPGTAPAALPLTPRAEAQLVDAWSAGQGPVNELPVPDMIGQQAARQPGTLAVTGTDASLTYGELDEHANRLAHHLRATGVGPQSVVGVLMDRSAALMVSLLAVWRAGAGYVPLDPALPPQRAAGMLADAGARVLVTRGSTPHAFDGTVIDVEHDAAAIAAHPPTPPHPAAGPDRTAYVVFTSGSTGRPKGVLVTHRGLANHVGWAVRELAARGTGGGAVFSSVAFDLVVPNLWAPLCAGQRVVLRGQDTGLDELGGWLVEHGPFSFLKLTPGHLEILSHQLTPQQAGDLAGVVVVAGEALPGTLAARWANWLGEGRLINEYGPTETTVGATVHPVPPDTPAGQVVPIGRPLPGMRVHVLDEHMRPVPVGGLGELFVGGTGVARGYVGRPELTAQRFLPDPYGPPGSRLYRTGDMVRWNTEGTVEFLGRADDQVKIRGYRVEPAEIAAALTSCPLVTEAVVTPREENGETQLIAYYTPATTSTPGTTAGTPGNTAGVPGSTSASGSTAGAPGSPAGASGSTAGASGSTVGASGGELAAYLAELLPEYMLPAAYVALETIPLNANGKVDRKALPAPPAPRDTVQDAPATPTEQRLAQIWSRVLGREQVNRTDSFFALGGHSILVVQVIAAARAEGLPLSVVMHYKTRNLAELAATLDAATATS